MDKIQKALDKLNNEERQKIKKILGDLAKSRIAGYDLKKLKGRDDIYRIRHGKIRIIFRRVSSGRIFILAIERRSDNTYNF